MRTQTVKTGRRRSGLCLVPLPGKCRLCRRPMNTVRVASWDSGDKSGHRDVDICVRCVVLALCSMATVLHGAVAGGYGHGLDRPYRDPHLGRRRSA